MFFLDTNICIYFLRGMSDRLFENMMDHGPSEVRIPSIVRAELLYGAYKSKLKKFNLETIGVFLSQLESVAFDYRAADAYAEIRATLEKKGKTIGPNDLVIAATVLATDGTLVTNNEKEFGRVPGLRMENWCR
jgi:tRNA(fMet)-specific endonuclease VapC